MTHNTTMPMTHTMPGQTSAIRAALENANGEWIAMPKLARLSGSLNVHTRVNEMRKRLGLAVECQIRRKPGSRRNYSFYRIPV
jgi:hypothetical protein